ncbi:MAG: DUF3109 family protein [Tannerella sp.]|jgi:hypothetical protein|nr:DUF3109 family protein [Tannerella sp.]
MLRIDDKLVSLDLIDRCFTCDTSLCHGACCVEGDAGAPLEEDEFEIIGKLLPIIRDSLSAEAQAVIDRQGVGYIDIEGDVVTSLVGGKECVFTCRDADGVCRCAIEKACRAGLTTFLKPVSCHLYPVRIKRYKSYTAVNYDRWKICRTAEIAGERTRTPLYRFLREPLIRKFGEAWYAELDFCAREYLRQNSL